MCGTSRVKTHKRKKKNGVSVVTEHTRKGRGISSKKSWEKTKNEYLNLVGAKHKRNKSSNAAGREWKFSQS